MIVQIDDWTFSAYNIDQRLPYFTINTHAIEAQKITWAWLTEARTIRKPIIDLELGIIYQIKIGDRVKILALNGHIENINNYTFHTTIKIALPSVSILYPDEQTEQEMDGLTFRRRATRRWGLEKTGGW